MAVDPLTGAIVPPPTPGHDEDVGWFLDYFSSGELKRYLAKGASQPVRDVLTVAAMSIGVTIISVIYVLQPRQFAQHRSRRDDFVDRRGGRTRASRSSSST